MSQSMTAPSIKEALKLKPCPFCGCEDIKFNHPNKEMGWRGSINCPACLVTMPRECGDQELIDCWNERAAPATLQPDGERREVIARILADPKHQERARYVQGFLYGDDHVIRDVALRENQEIFRTKDEHEYEQRLEIEKAKFAAGAILASGLVQDEAATRADEREVAAQAVLARIRKVRDGYANQAKFADVDPACYFREFVRRLDEAVSPKSTIRSARDGGKG